MAEGDRREQILDRLVDVLASGTTAAAYRNQFTLAESKRPCFVVLDADETAEAHSNSRGAGSAGDVPYLVTMEPEIWLLTAGDPDTIGTAVNALRLAAIAAVTQDADLQGLCAGGGIRYTGISTGLQAGRSAEVEAQIRFQFEYIIHPNAL